MGLRGELGELGKNTKRDLKQLYEQVKQYPLVSLLFFIAVLLLIAIPHWQVSLSEINNATVEAAQENQNRAILAQIFGGVAIVIGLYYTWRRIGIAEEDLKVTQQNLIITQDNLKATQKSAQDNLEVARQSQITERFTRATDQLGNEKMEIRLGGIYALERIAKESKDDYWPIMEILTAYVRKNSPVKRELKRNNQPIEPISVDIQDKESTKNEVLELRKLPLDIEAIIIVIGRRNNYFGSGESNSLNLKEICLHMGHFDGFNFARANLTAASLKRANLRKANLRRADLTRADLRGADLTRADLKGADLRGADLYRVNLRGADLRGADLRGVDLDEANLTVANLRGVNLIVANLRGADLRGADLRRANFRGADLRGADLREADLKRANFTWANLRGAKLTDSWNIESSQISKVKTLYKAQLDEWKETQLKEKYPALFEEPK